MSGETDEKILKPPAPGLVDAIAKAIDGWHSQHPDLTVGEIVRALAKVGNDLGSLVGKQYRRS
jgi:hypothetical protein